MPSNSGIANFLDSTEDALDGEVLRDRLATHGYVFLRQQVDPRLLDRVRGDYLAAMDAHGWIVGDPQDRDAVADKFTVEPEPEFRSVYHEAYRSEAFHSVPHTVAPLLKRIIGDDLLIHPRLIGRIVFPASQAPGGNDYTTPAHQDYVSVQGTTEAYTCWTPLHDVSWEQGPLAMADGSQRDGVRPMVPAFGTGGSQIEGIPDSAWRSGPFTKGDIVIFNSLTVHRGLPNLTKYFRMSMDFRFQSASEPIGERSLDLSSGSLTWESLYSGWEDTSRAYFWRDRDLDVVPFDNKYEEQRNAIAIEFAERGDPRSISSLQRMAVHDPDEANRERATELLRQLGAPLG